MVHKKINRYWFSLLIILAVSAIPYLFRSGLPFSEALLTIGIISAIVYLFYLLYNVTVGRAIKSDLFAILSGIGVAFALPGAVLKIMHWPGGGLFIKCTIACAGLLVFFIVMDMSKKASSE